jgi:RHS repeat-associated protein
LVHDTYGEVYGATGSSQTVFGFTGEETDGTGLINLRARYYNPALGIFPSLDPLEGNARRPGSLNRYAYVFGNVINGSDPSGMEYASPTPGPWNPCAAQAVKSCPDAANYLKPPTNHSVIDQTYARYDNSFATGNDETGLGAVAVRYSLSGLADLARDRGKNTQAATNLYHWLFGGGVPVMNYPVDQMLQELPLFQQDSYTEMLKAEAGFVLTKPHLAQQVGHACKAWTVNTWDPNNPRRWRRVGKSGDPNPLSASDRDIYQGVNTNLDDISAFWANQGRDFDWWISMNAFNYTVAEGIVLDEASNTVQICYQIYIEDHYGWYNHPPYTGEVDRTMSRAEKLGVGQNYPISGHSSIICQTRKLDELKQVLDPNFTNLGQ